MRLELRNRDTTGVLIAYVEFGSESFYCMAPVENWIGVWWNGYVDIELGSLESEYFNYLKKFRLKYEELQSAYNNLFEIGDEYDLEANKPQLYVDFRNKYLASYYQEQELERRIPNGWKGEHRKIENLVPLNCRYWEKETSS